MVLKYIHPLQLNGLCTTDNNKQQEVTTVTEASMQQQQILREQSSGWLMEVSGPTARWHEPKYLTMILWHVHSSLKISSTACQRSKIIYEYGRYSTKTCASTSQPYLYIL